MNYEEAKQTLAKVNKLTNRKRMSLHSRIEAGKLLNDLYNCDTEILIRLGVTYKELELSYDLLELEDK